VERRRYGVGEGLATHGDLEAGLAGLPCACSPIHARFAAGGNREGVGATFGGEPGYAERRGHGQRLVGVVVDRGGNGGHVPHHQEARGLETHQEGLPGANRRPRDSYPSAAVGGTRSGAPSGERIGEGHLDACLTAVVGHQIGNPECRRAKVVTDPHRRRLRAGGFVRLGHHVSK
jgi:hypothetical protein